jgi:hypothetical protein
MNPQQDSSPSPFPTIEILVEASEPAVRNREPVTCGIPLPKGMLRNDPRYLMLFEKGHQSVPVQTRALDFWSDGSIRWLLLDWQATVKGTTRCRLELTDMQPAMATAGALSIHQEIKGKKGQLKLFIIKTGNGEFQIAKGDFFPFASATARGAAPTSYIQSDLEVEFDHETGEGKIVGDKIINILHAEIINLRMEEVGLVRSTYMAESALGFDVKNLPHFQGRLSFFSNSSCIRMSITMRNPKRAKHPGGIWSLGDKGSVFQRGVSFNIEIHDVSLSLVEQDLRIAVRGGHSERAAQLSELAEMLKKKMGQEPEKAVVRSSFEMQAAIGQKQGPFQLQQNSSGGDNWQSSNHVNRHGVVGNTFCGYRLELGRMLSPPATIPNEPEDQKGGESMAPSTSPAPQAQTGSRATPIVTLERSGQTIGLAMRYFWQNFPKAIEAGPNSLTLRLFPKQHGDLHELQGGEQKTHEFVVAFGKDEVTPDEPLAWVRSPARVRVDPTWYAASRAIPNLIPETEDPNADYIKLVRAAIEGDDTFEKKREVIDEYGWRNFGDIYADHEAIPKEMARGKWHQVSNLPEKGQVENLPPRRPPLVSHYNNQYDPLAGFAIQFMRSGDWRWWDAMNELAAHVVDIDIYHTDQDKAAYNHGLFWHTVHYTDAGLSTHRSYPRAPGVHGGGPGNEHNYTTGLMLHYFLTGNHQSREAAINLAQWVIDMDDGTKTIFRWLDRGYTGLASATGSPDYHGPGRGAGNSINALLDGHRLAAGSGNPRRAQIFLDKAEQLIRRCMHPADEIAARNLLDAERRWSYTVCLQAIGKYLDYKAEREELDWMYAYGRAALLHYARWMADHEYPFLEKPEILEYPTETWVAQDMRKSEVFKFATKHAEGEERARFLERSEFFFRYVTTTLMGMKTRTLARPVVILLSNGHMHAYFQRHPDVGAPPPKIIPTDFGKPQVFVPQKVRAKRRFVMVCVGLAVIGLVVVLGWLV